MRLGLFAMPLHHPARDTAAVIAEDREAVIVADRLGYDEAWIGEHFTSKAEPIVSPLMFLASLAPVTSKIRLGTGVVNLPHQHPAAVAAQAAFFDQLSGGRLMLGIGPGGLPSDAELFKDTDGAVRGRMMLESIEIIQAIWKGDPPYRFQGEFWDIDLKSVILPDYGVGVMPKPVQRPHPPIAIALRSPNSSTARLAGEKGWIPISANFVPSAHVATHWPLYAEGCEAAGRRPDPADWRVARSQHVTDRDEEAADYVADPEGGLAFYFRYLATVNAQRARPGPPDAATAAEIDEHVDHALATMVIAGSPKTVLDRLVHLRDEVGPFGTLLATGHDWDGRADMWRHSMTLLASEVMPKLAQHSDANRSRG